MNISSTHLFPEYPIDPRTAQLAVQLLDGLTTVTDFVLFCQSQGWTVSDINIVTEKITLCRDTGKVDADNFPIIIWHDLVISHIARG